LTRDGFRGILPGWGGVRSGRRRWLFAFVKQKNNHRRTTTGAEARSRGS